MLSRNAKKTPWLIIALIMLSFFIIFSPAFTSSSAGTEDSLQKSVSSPGESNPIIVYYSRTGKTRIVANTLKDQFSCEIAEIKSTKDREGYLGVFTCVLDSLFNRDDQIEPFNKDLKGYSPIIIVSPIWLGKLSSPARTLIKQNGLQGKEVHIFITYNGRLTEEKEKALEDGITSQGIKLNGLYKIITKEKTVEDIKKDISTQLEKRPILKKVTNL